MSSDNLMRSEMDRHGLLQGRLSPPAFRIALLERPALARLEAEGLNHKVVLVSAPAGYGKSALLSQWRSALKRREIPAAWITLTPTDTDPAQLLTYVTMSLIAVGSEVGPLGTLAEQWFADTPIATASASLAGHLVRDNRPLVLIIDDIHYAPRAVVEQVLGPLLDAGLPHVRLALVGRSRPALPLADLRARGEVLEFDAYALRFDDGELMTLLPDLTVAQRSLLAARTEGWPVAVQLARLWLTAKPDRVGLLESFSGRTTEVADYLTEQVLSDLPKDICETLELTAPLDALCDDIVTAVTGSSNAWSGVVGLSSLAHLVAPLDESRTWYRLHPLLADYLRDRLRRQAPDLEVRCHEQASLWFESKNLTREAAHHAIATDSIARAAALIENAGGWELVVFGGAGLMRALLAAFPSDRFAEFPRVALCRALMDAKNGALSDARRRLEETARTIARDGEAPLLMPVGRDLLVIRHLIACYGDSPIAPNTLTTTQGEIDALAPDDGAGRAVLLAAANYYSLGLGEMLAARAACERGVVEMRALGSVLGANYGAIHLGFALFHLGHRREAEATFREATELAEENFGVDSGLRAIADVALAVALTARGDTAGAAALFDRSLPQVEAQDGWLDVFAEAYGAAISTALVSRDIARAQAYIERGSVTAMRRGLKRLERLMAAHRIRLAVLTGRFQEVRASIDWREGEWRQDPNRWREHHAHGIAAAELEIVCGDSTAARAILVDLAAAAATGNRAHDARRVAFLDAIARFAAGLREEAATTVIELLEPALSEEDTEFLVEPNMLGVPLLQYIRQWMRDRIASSLVREVVGRAVRRLATTGDSKPQKGIGLLSGRELEVLMELVQGSPNKVIARALQMTENTVKFHLKNIFQKLHVSHRAQAVRVAREQGLD
jgi:LuxR family maltose regulon positive regulatory protein